MNYVVMPIFKTIHGYCYSCSKKACATVCHVNCTIVCAIDCAVNETQ